MMAFDIIVLLIVIANTTWLAGSLPPDDLVAPTATACSRRRAAYRPRVQDISAIARIATPENQDRLACPRGTTTAAASSGPMA